MLIDGNIYIAEYSLDTLLPKRGPNTYASGLLDKDKGHVKYGPPGSTQPTLQIVQPIYDGNRNAIPTGYYELNLSDDNCFIILCQRGQAIAKVPIFKIEQDEEKTKKYAEQHRKPRNLKEKIKFKVKEKWDKRQREKKLNNKFIEENPEVYNEATIEYDVAGDYYIIKYERNEIRAWGVLKSNY